MCNSHRLLRNVVVLLCSAGLSRPRTVALSEVPTTEQSLMSTDAFPPILLTGATGKTGRAVAAALRVAGIPHRLGVRRPHAPNSVLFDWNDPRTFRAAMVGTRSLYLVKPPLGPAPVVASLLAQAPDLQRVVLLSEMGREQKPSTDPERAVELLVEAGPWASTILRPSWFLQNWEPGSDWGDQLQRSGRIVVPSADAGFALVDVRDVADVVVAALADDNGLGGLTLTGPESITLAALAERIGAATGRIIRHTSPTLAAAAQFRVDAGWSPGLLSYWADIESDAAAGVCSAVHGDLARVLGRDPRTIDQYVAENAGHWSDRPRN